MLSLLDVQCPHCGARGQIMVPPVGAIIIGPCPQCSELVTVFCGQVLPLEKSIMESGAVEERRDHLLDALTGFLRDRIDRLIANDEGGGEDELSEPTFETEADAEDSSAAAQASSEASGPISQNEFDQFMEVDLKLLDNKSYFNSVFGPN